MQGTLDIMIQRTGTSNTDKILFVQNNFYYDAFFLKAIGTLSITKMQVWLSDDM
jgi:hypothetical protein